MPGEVIYPNYCPSGIVLKELNGNRQYPADENLGRKLSSKLGFKIIENIDFVVKIRELKYMLLCDLGEISGGKYIDGEWQMGIMGLTDRKPLKSLIPVQFAELPDPADKINFEISSEIIEEIVHILRVGLVHERVTNEAWVLVNKFCERFKPIEDEDLVRYIEKFSNNK